MRRSYILPLFALFSVSASACSSSDSELPATPPVISDPPPITTIQLSPTHSVEIRELRPGLIAFVETGSIDERDKPIGFDEYIGMPLPEVFTRLAPGMPVPTDLEAAETRRREFLAIAATEPLEMVGPVDDLAPTSSGGPLDLATDNESGGVASAFGAETNSTDGGIIIILPPIQIDPTPPGWDWDAERVWFEDQFCQSGDVDSVWCATNKSWANSGSRKTMYFDTTMMNAHFGNNASGLVEYWDGSWKTFSSETIAPRYWRRFWFESVGWFRSRIEGSGRIHLSERYRHGTPTFNAAGDFPFDRSFDAANDMQGVTHDANNWYFTSAVSTISGVKSRIWKVPVTTNLNTSPTIYGNPWQGQFNHFGDITYANGAIFVPMEASGGTGGKCAFGAFNTNIQYYGYATLPDSWPQIVEGGGGYCPWLAYNPKDGLFYSSTFNPQYLYKYSITIHPTAPRVRVSYVGKVRLRDGNGNPITLDRIQGGVFSQSGKLYLSRDRNGGIGNGGGIAVIDPNNGRWQALIPVNFQGPPSEEIEGIDIWDLSDGRAPGITSQVHVIMVQNDTFSNDNWYFKHFDVPEFNKL